MVDESTEIFFPIFQFGCLIASSTLIDLNFDKGKFKKGPPDAVIKISFTSKLSLLFKQHQIEKCSESTGTNSVLFFLTHFQSNSTHKLRILCLQ